jgi:hypothetical protein
MPDHPTTAASPDRVEGLSLRVRNRTLAAIQARAQSEGLTLKQVVVQAMAASGLDVDSVDLEDGTPRRRP